MCACVYAHARARVTVTMSLWATTTQQRMQLCAMQPSSLIAYTCPSSTTLPTFSATTTHHIPMHDPQQGTQTNPAPCQNCSHPSKCMADAHVACSGWTCRATTPRCWPGTITPRSSAAPTSRGRRSSACMHTLTPTSSRSCSSGLVRNALVACCVMCMCQLLVSYFMPVGLLHGPFRS